MRLSRVLAGDGHDEHPVPDPRVTPAIRIAMSTDCRPIVDALCEGHPVSETGVAGRVTWHLLNAPFGRQKRRPRQGLQFEQKQPFLPEISTNKGENDEIRAQSRRVDDGHRTAASLTGGTAQATPAGPLSGVFNHMKNAGNNLCLQPDVPVDGGRVVQEDCDANNLAQGWQFLRLTTKRYEFVNQLSGLCLSVFVAPADGSPMGLQRCREASGQQFNSSDTLPHDVTLESRFGFKDTGLCLDVPGGLSTRGLQMQIFGCNGTPAQQWVVGFA
jgi:hypothetical protein